MTQVVLVGLIGVAVSALAPAGRAPDKISCVLAHESAQDLRQRDLLAQSREKLLFCSDPRCPPLVAEECGTLLAEIDRLRASAHAGDTATAPSDSQDAASDERETSETPPTPANAAAPVATPPPPQTAAECCALAQQPTPDRTAPSLPQGAPLPRASPRREPPIKRARPSEAWRAPLVSGTLTVVALAGAAYFGWRGRSGAEQLGRTCSPDCDPSDVTPVRRQLLIADLSLLAGVGLGALTAWMVWDGRTHETGGAPAVPRRRRDEPAPDAGWSLVPRFGSLQMEYRGHF